LNTQLAQGDGGPGRALDQGALDGAQPIGATEITFDIGDKAIECLGRASAAVELAARKQLEHVPPQLNQGDSRGAEDGRGYRH